MLDCVSESMENARSFKWRRNFYFIIRHSISKGGKSEAKELLCKAGCAVNLHDWKYVDSNWDKDRQFSLDNWKFHKEWKVICGDDTTSRKTEMRITDLLSVGPCVFEVVPLSRVICFPLGSRHTSISANDIHRPYFSGKSTTGRIGFSQSRYKATGLPVQGVGNATDILAINFAPQYEQSWETLYGTLYVDPKHKRILGLDGYITPFRITQTDAGGCISVTPKVSIGYTHERGFTEVQYITVRIDEGDLHIHSAAYNIGKRKPTDWPSGDSHTHLPGTTEDLTPVNQ